MIVSKLTSLYTRGICRRAHITLELPTRDAHLSIFNIYSFMVRISDILVR